MLKQTLDSILKQTFKDFEVLVIDNYSTDDTEKVVKSFKDKRIKYFKNKNNGLLAVNRNYAIKHAKGKFIAICDDDDLWLPSKLEEELAEFEKNPDIGLVCTNGISFNEKGEEQIMGSQKDQFFSFQYMMIDNPVMCSSAMIKKSVFDDVGILDESRDIFTAEDYEMWLRVAKKYKIKYLGEPLVKYRIHSGALQNQFLAGEKTLVLFENIYKKLLEKKVIDEETYRKSLKKVNYQNIILKLINNDKSLNMKIIYKIKMSRSDKFKIMIYYILLKIGLLNKIRRKK
jgi:glycosyltransferase involved in cell wall biosynthesis